MQSQLEVRGHWGVKTLGNNDIMQRKKTGKDEGEEGERSIVVEFT